MAELTDLSTDPRSVAAGIREWLASGRLQSAGGAYAAWLDPATGRLAFDYPEITGYALTWLAGRAGPEQDELQAGRRAADWLVERLAAGDRSARAGWDDGAVYNFDLGMIAAGLLSFGRLTGEGRYAEQGQRIAEDLARQVLAPSGLRAVSPDGPATSRPGGWSTVGRPHLVKCVQALLLAGDHEAAELLVRYAYEEAAPDGRLRTAPGEAEVMLHPHLYTVEGLWMLGTACGDEAALAAAREATLWAWRRQLPSGALPRWASDEATGPEQLDVTSQAIRAAVLLEVDPPGLDAAVARLAGQARHDGDHGIALVYQPDAPAPHLNAWVTMFAGQALAAVTGEATVDWDTLV
jgi:hypothetical protein